MSLSPVFQLATYTCQRFPPYSYTIGIGADSFGHQYINFTRTKKYFMTFILFTCFIYCTAIFHSDIFIYYCREQLYSQTFPIIRILLFSLVTHFPYFVFIVRWCFVIDRWCFVIDNYIFYVLPVIQTNGLHRTPGGIGHCVR